jgi:hypothetical protein
VHQLRDADRRLARGHRLPDDEAGRAQDARAFQLPDHHVLVAGQDRRAHVERRQERDAHPHARHEAEGVEARPS